MLLPGAGPPPDTGRLQELLLDHTNPRSQSQAALLLVQLTSPEAETIVREGLRQTDSQDVFLALTAAVRLCQDQRFDEEIWNALVNNRLALRQAAADALAALPDPTLTARLRKLVEDADADLPVRQAVLGALGRSGRRETVAVLIDQLSSENDALRRSAIEALTELSGQTLGDDLARWLTWWERHKDDSNEHWLEQRLSYQIDRAHRLRGDSERLRSQVVQLEQQLHARLPTADRLAHVQAVAEHEDAAVRVLAVGWSLELLPTVDSLGQRSLTDLLLRLARDGALEVQRPAVLALGKVDDPRAFELVAQLLRQGPITVRVAAARSLAQQTRGTGPDATARLRRAVPALQKALEDSAFEVVIEAAEDLGMLGIPEAGPVLAALLQHPSAPVRQTAAQALERMADHTVLDGLLTALDDPSVTVRFSLVGALGHAVGDGKILDAGQRRHLVERLETLLVRDTDPGVRSRAATVLGDVGSPSVLQTLWQRVLSSEESRVQEKAWGAMIELLARSPNTELLHDWDRRLVEARQDDRRVQLLTEVCLRWSKREEKGPLAVGQELLAQAQLDQGKWSAALPVVRELLAKATSDAEAERRLRLLLAAGEQALKEGHRIEAQQAVQDAQPHLVRAGRLAAAFAALDKQARQP
jgi:HEAT repeat protein